MKIFPRLTLRTAGFAMLFGGLALGSFGQKVVYPNLGAPGTWRLLGQTHAKHTIDHDSITVRGPYDNFRRIKFRVTDAPLKMLYMMVTYDSGSRDRIDIRYNIPQGGYSREIDLRGVGKRSLRRIEFWYDTRGWGRGMADVTLFGMK